MSPLRRLTAVLLLGVIVGVGAGQLRCTSSGSSNVHPWGSYSMCLTAQVDTCTALDGGCYPTSLTNNVKLGADLDSGTFYLYRGVDAPVLGQQQGTRFEVVTNTADGGLLETACGCAANLVETIWGELQPEAPATSCPDSGTNQCFPETDAGYLPENWLAEGDGGLDASVTYKGLTAVAEDVLTVAPDGGADGGCPCLPCRVVYNISGTLSQ